MSIIKKNTYNSIVAEAEKMAVEFIKKGNVNKVKYLTEGNEKYRMTFLLTTEKSVVKVERKERYGYNTIVMWDTDKTDKNFPQYTYETIKENVRMEARAVRRLFMDINEDANEEKVETYMMEIYGGMAKSSGYSMDEIMGMAEEEEVKICAICGRPYSGFGNNADPVVEGRCCDECNMTEVIPARIYMMRKKNA